MKVDKTKDDPICFLEGELLWAKLDLIDLKVKHKIEFDAFLIIAIIQSVAILGLSLWVWWW